MRTPWEQARFEAVQSAIKRNESRLQGVEIAAPSSTVSPSAAAQAMALASEVLAKVKELVPAATQEQIMGKILGKVAPMVQQSSPLLQPLPTPTMPKEGMGMTTKTMGIITLAAGAAVGAGLLYFLLRKKSAR